MFRVGQKVVCVDDSPAWHDGRLFLTRDQVYIVSAVSNERRFAVAPRRLRQDVGIHVGGINLPDWEWIDQRRFRAFVELKTDISIFTKILDDVREKSPVRVG